MKVNFDPKSFIRNSMGTSNISPVHKILSKIHIYMCFGGQRQRPKVKLGLEMLAPVTTPSPQCR